MQRSRRTHPPTRQDTPCASASWRTRSPMRPRRSATPRATSRASSRKHRRRSTRRAPPSPRRNARSPRQRGVQHGRRGCGPSSRRLRRGTGGCRETAKELRGTISEGEKAAKAQERAAQDAQARVDAAQAAIDEANDIHAHPRRPPRSSTLLRRIAPSARERVVEEVEQLAGAGAGRARAHTRRPRAPHARSDGHRADRPAHAIRLDVHRAIACRPYAKIRPPNAMWRGRPDFHARWRRYSATSTSSISKLRSLPASSWLASSLIPSGETSTTVAGTGMPPGPCRKSFMPASILSNSGT